MKRILVYVSLILVIFTVSCDDYMEELSQQTGLNEGLVAYWPMNENVSSLDSYGEIIYDFSEKNDLTLDYDNPDAGFNPSAISVDGKYGKALFFDGSDDSAYCYSNNVLKSSSNFSVAFWIKDPIGNTLSCITTQSFKILFDRVAPGSGYVEFTVTDIDSGITTASVNYPVSLNLGNWNYIVGTYDQENVSLYINGNLVSKTPHNKKINIINSIIICPVSGMQHLNATIDDMRIYNRALKQDEIKALMKIGVD